MSEANYMDGIHELMFGTYGTLVVERPGAADTAPAVADAYQGGDDMADGTCSVQGCGRVEQLRRGWCRKHYERWRRNGDPERYIPPGERKPLRRSLSHRPIPIAKLHDAVELLYARSEVTASGCWEWLSPRLPKGYGKLSIGGLYYYAHRVSYVAFVGPIPDGLQIDHLCNNPPCINPAHLLAVTAAENILRGDGPPARNARKTHCKNGHEFTPENTYVTPKGHRACRPCKRAFLRAYKARRRATEAT